MAPFGMEPAALARYSRAWHTARRASRGREAQAIPILPAAAGTPADNRCERVRIEVRWRMSEEISAFVARARQAQKQVEFWSQARVDRMVAAVGWSLYRPSQAERCARLAVQETGMGVFEDKLFKHRRKTLGTLRDLQGVRTVGVLEEDAARGLIKLAKPVGVVGAITPVTNPSSTPACNALAILKTRNAVVFSPHPLARRTTALTVDLIRSALARVGAPRDLVQVLSRPSRAGVRELMACVDLVLATGSSDLVQGAYSSGTPAYGVGAGNAVVVVDESADLADAARKIRLSKTFDYATSCSSENSLVIQRAIYAPLLAALEAEGGFLCDAAAREALEMTLWPDGRELNPRIVAQSAVTIAGIAGIELPAATRFLMVHGSEPVAQDPFAHEKLSPVLTLWVYDRFDEAIARLEEITRQCGYGHSCGIHSRDDAHIRALAEQAHVSRVMVRQPQCYANSGSFENGMPFSMTLGCGTWGGNITTDNITWRHFLNITWVSTPIPAVEPDEFAIFGAHWQEFGRDGEGALSGPG